MQQKYKNREPDRERTARQVLFGQMLKDSGYVTEEQIQIALNEDKDKKMMLGTSLIRLKYVTEDQILEAISKFLGMKRVDISNLELTEDLIEMIPVSFVQIYRVIPVSYEDGILELAQENALKLDQLRDITLLFGYEIRGVVCKVADVQRIIEKYYKLGDSESIDDLIGAAGADMVSATGSTDRDVIDLNVDDLKKMADVAPVKSFVNTVLLHAVKEGASDIHFEPFESEYIVRYRVDNILYQKASPPNDFGVGITTRIKVMSNLNISERRMPQDGRIKLRIMGTPVEFRVSCLPTKFGESVVLRIFNKENASVGIKDLGFHGYELELMEKSLNMPNGIILVTGPTGSGKTCTLYSVLSHKNTPDVKIITTEDPVENDIEGIMQIPINPNVGTTFASSLRAILRQDPDIILVGEIRDEETAMIAVQAALTGHLVLSTLHTNDSPSAITRLVDMGIQPFLISATIRAVVSQRLIRRICTDCKEEHVPDAMLLKEINLTMDDMKGQKFYHGKGCDNCRDTGYKGRLAIFEVMGMNDDISRLVIGGASVSEIRISAQKSGMNTLRESGLGAVSEGLTTLEQIISETVQE
ncbi:MAG: GspE/PulE family protein [Candidatus Anammoxibacter sp.]